MNTPITKTLILTLTLCVSALNIFADTKLVDSGTVIESGSTYAATTAGNTPALHVTGSETRYEGTNITLINERQAWTCSGVSSGASLVLRDSAIIVDAIPRTVAYGLSIGAGTDVELQNVNITLYGEARTGDTLSSFAGIRLGGSSTTAPSKLFASGLHITGSADIPEAATNYDYAGIYVSGNTEVTVTDFSITLWNEGVGVNTWTGPEEQYRVEQKIILSSGTITVYKGAGVAIGGNGKRDVELHDVDIRGGEEFGLRAIYLYNSEGDIATEKTLLVDGGNIVAGSNIALAVASRPGGNYAITITGSANLSGTAVMELNGGTTHIAVEDGVTLSGDTNVKGSATATINLDDSTLTGDITGIEDSNLTLSGSNGATITGTVSGNDHAIIDLTVSGTGSTILGDITQSGSSAVTVILDNSATGTGGYHGGNLITGGDSVWTFTKDSHGNYGENNGTWNIGDYDVTFDNLTNSGTININVNSDTGEGGSITVDTAGGEGTVHIDTTGNGKADPNQVLPGKVTGDGTENWQWDPIDWGIDTIIKDGDHFIKQGTSPAGAVLNSSVAIQQAMWFAQQNSLLKRMGDLRYGARASRPLAGETPAFHNLIDNIWLRSYGQQLNVGSKVVGKAYEQLIYGVDLGTDHKFTLSADSDLYLGVYAGYGRSDLDYRTPGADGEINSYYGGLYATWLHASGFYIDATFKAASVNNDLKAPYGGTQLKASYSDVNLGGSIEIGNKFTFTDGWFIEPQFQVNYLHILAENYTAGPLTISAQDLDALQLRIGSVFGRPINLTNSGALQPYVKISGVETISSGGTIRNGYQSTRANTDGARAEIGGGIIWQLDANNQLHLDYEASFGDKYDKPWGLTAGYRHQF